LEIICEFARIKIAQVQILLGYATRPSVRKSVSSETSEFTDLYGVSRTSWVIEPGPPAGGCQLREGMGLQDLRPGHDDAPCEGRG